MSKKTSPFTYVDAVSYTKERLLTRENEKEYSPWLTNKALSLHSDTILYANEMNFHHHLDPLMQHDYYLGILRKRSRRGAWPKQAKDEAEAIAAFGYRWNLSPAKAREAIRIARHDVVEETVKMYREQNDSNK